MQCLGGSQSVVLAGKLTLLNAKQPKCAKRVGCRPWRPWAWDSTRSPTHPTRNFSRSFAAAAPHHSLFTTVLPERQTALFPPPTPTLPLRYLTNPLQRNPPHSLQFLPLPGNVRVRHPASQKTVRVHVKQQRTSNVRIERKGVPATGHDRSFTSTRQAGLLSVEHNEISFASLGIFYQALRQIDRCLPLLHFLPRRLLAACSTLPPPNPHPQPLLLHVTLSTVILPPSNTD